MAAEVEEGRKPTFGNRAGISAARIQAAVIEPPGNATHWTGSKLKKAERRGGSF